MAGGAVIAVITVVGAVAFQNDARAGVVVNVGGRSIDTEIKAKVKKFCPAGATIMFEGCEVTNPNATLESLGIRNGDDVEIECQ